MRGCLILLRGAVSTWRRPLDEQRGVVIWQSADGQQWTQLPASNDLNGAIPFRLQALADKWVLIGSRTTGGNPVQMIWTSTDGTTWAGQVVTTDQSALVLDVGAIGETAVVIGSYGDGGPTTTGAAWLGSLP